ncbi:hypothetical protein [Saccharothrix longispora]|uniref:hypothetical protein n=1 Tax=Saccharothrix longispora TaxID=33920 RepID=UPI0028FDB7F3|nr:hypothetical protein [Saccharothrix longispora]MDU0294184.1 hypothetical protein [Saccharothrix longispora]
MTTTTGKSTPPPTIVAAFAGFLVSSATALATGLLLLGARQEALDAVRSGSPSTSQEEAEFATTVALGVAVGIALLVALVYLWLSFKLKAGRNRARVVLTLFTLVQAASLIAGQGNVVGYVSVAAAAVAVVLAYLPASNAYVASVERAG